MMCDIVDVAVGVVDVADVAVAVVAECCCSWRC